MAYTALYRKWRPTRFEEVRGQDAIVKTLKNQLKSGRIGHAYLFSGTRGTGKTTVAKIFARAVNCEHPVDGSPCNECPTCREILTGNSVNVVEIDAASNNGVDNIREIREEVRYRPTEGKYRVYIIDEVHMLSTGAFNALLKTLEEPPEYVIFILATTEVHRIPVTVLSRCQRYDFKRLPLSELENQVRDLLNAEGVEAEEAAVRYIARKADGSSRDCLSLLEECISFNFGEVLTYERVLEVLGAVDQTVFSELIRGVIGCDISRTTGLIDELIASGRDLSQFVTDLTWYLRNLLLLQTGDPTEDVLGVSKENLAVMKQEASDMDIDQAMRYIRILSQLNNDMRYSPSRRVLLEIALMKMMQPEMEEDTESLKDRVRQLEDIIKNGQFTAGKAGNSGSAEGSSDGRTGALTPEKDNAPKAPQKTTEVPEAVYEDYAMIRKDWEDIVRNAQRLLRSLLQKTEVSASESGIEILAKDSFTYAALERGHREKEVEELLKARYQKEFRVRLRQLKSTESAPRIVPGKRIPGIEMDIEEE